MVANVTAGSVSLRGLGGGSQASRTLVLLDGIPMNDAYGGWVAWARAPREILDRVEVVRGGGASVWGNLSLGGVINLMTSSPLERSLSVSALVGDHRTTDLTLALGDAGDAWSGWVSGNAFDTDGYYTCARGPDRSDRRAHGEGVRELPRQGHLRTLAPGGAAVERRLVGRGPREGNAPRSRLERVVVGGGQRRRRDRRRDLGLPSLRPASGLGELLGARAPRTAPARRRRTTSSINPRTCWGRTPPGRGRWPHGIGSSPAPTSSASRSSTIKT